MNNASISIFSSEKQMNASIDIFKVIMAFLVVGIHTEPFAFNIWLDRGFGIITRICVPFFFVSSAYFYWLKDSNALKYFRRILLLYAVWSIIYLPFDLKDLSTMNVGQIIYKYLWVGNDHALWYLCGSAIGFIITYTLLKFLKPKAVLIIACCFLIVGCIKSTWSPLIEDIFSIRLSDWLGSRNGLFYAFPYIALGMFIAKKHDYFKNKKLSFYIAGFIVSLIALGIESLIFVVIFDTQSTILWFSVLPWTYFTFIIVNKINIFLTKQKSLFLRKVSTLIYVIQYLFIPLYSRYFSFVTLWILVSVSTVILAVIIIKLSSIKLFYWLKYLY